MRLRFQQDPDPVDIDLGENWRFRHFSPYGGAFGSLCGWEGRSICWPHPGSTVKKVLPNTPLRIAAEHDACGHHDAALDALAGGTRAGDLECMGWLGLRLLTGDRAPAYPAEGEQLLAEAAARGNAWAANRAAAMLALGVGVPPDWPKALQWLVRAAQAGHEKSRSQLLGLAGESIAINGARDGSSWSELAARIDLAAWRSSPPPR